MCVYVVGTNSSQCFGCTICTLKQYFFIKTISKNTYTYCVYGLSLSIQNKGYDKSFKFFQTFILITFLNQIKSCISAKCQRKFSNLASGVCYKNIIWQFQSSFYCCSGITLYPISNITTR